MTAAQAWLDAFAAACAAGDGEGVAALFEPGGLWRDYLPFGWTLQTVEGRPQIADFAAVKAKAAGFGSARFEGEAEAQEGFLGFQTHLGRGRGYLRLRNGRCATLFTMLADLSKPPAARGDDPSVLIVGGGQSGLALGAQLADLNVPYLIVDKHPRIGDQWRSRYDSLVLHDPVWYDHMPFLPFPDDWPVFTPKNRMCDWLEAYAERLSLSVWTNAECLGAAYDAAAGDWEVSIRKAGEVLTLRPRRLVFALGISGFPRIPAFKGQDQFRGAQMHSSAYQGAAAFAGQDVVVVGANNSAHDIAADLAASGARPVMIQRSSTLVVRQADYCEKLLGPLYSAEAVARGITTEKADILAASVPLRLLEKQHRPIWDRIREEQSAYYQRLTDAGFQIDFAEDGTGLGMKYRRTASGYYIDVGAAEMVMDGRIGLRSGVAVDSLTEQGVKLDTGEILPAAAVVYATGFGSMTDWVAALIGPEVADRVGPCWGYGSGTRGDPGPWLGELRNMWRPTAQPGLWFMGGNLSQARFYSRLLALQLAGRLSDG